MYTLHIFNRHQNTITYYHLLNRHQNIVIQIHYRFLLKHNLLFIFVTCTVRLAKYLVIASGTLSVTDPTAA